MTGKTPPSLTMPSHGGVNNPDWRFSRDTDLRTTFASARLAQVGPITRVKLSLILGRVVAK